MLQVVHLNTICLYIMTFNLNILGFFCFAFHQVYGQCTPEVEDVAIFHGEFNRNGTILTCIKNVGTEMCVRLCYTTVGCTSVNMDRQTLTCELLDGVDGEESLAQEESMSFARLKRNKPCGLLTCQRLQTCVTLSSGQQISATIKQHCCHSNRFITYGNPDVIVTWSSVFSSSDPSYSAYWLNSYYGWSPAAADQSQWIQAVFRNRRIVIAVATNKQKHNVQYVTSYSLKYLDDSNTWRNLTDKTGNNVIFAGNNAHDNEAKVNNLPEAVMTSGIQLIPLSWNDWITLRFDVIGC